MQDKDSKEFLEENRLVVFVVKLKEVSKFCNEKEGAPWYII